VDSTRITDHTDNMTKVKVHIISFSFTLGKCIDFFALS